MRFNKTLFYLGLTVNVLTLIFIINIMGQPGGSGAPMVFMFYWLPWIWIVTIVIATILTIKNRRIWFTEMKWWTIFSFFLCTPVPLMVIVRLVFGTYGTENGARTTMSMYTYKDGKRVKMERWSYDNGQTYLDKYFMADSLNELRKGEEAFLKDSIWIYYNKEGEIVKQEKYKYGKLISAW